MIKVNRKLILLLVLMLIVGILGGCSEKLPGGVENKAFLKDMNDLYDLVDKSIVDRDYYKNDIDKIVEKMNEAKYLKNLNDYEKSIFELAKETLKKAENDLITGKKMIQSYTFDEIESIWKMLDD